VASSWIGGLGVELMMTSTSLALHKDNVKGGTEGSVDGRIWVEMLTPFIDGPLTGSSLE
jgi:hypothetical protein